MFFFQINETLEQKNLIELIPKELHFEVVDTLTQFDIVDWTFTVNSYNTGVQVSKTYFNGFSTKQTFPFYYSLKYNCFRFFGTISYKRGGQSTARGPNPAHRDITSGSRNTLFNINYLYLLYQSNF